MIAGERIVHGRAPLASIADLARGVERWRGRGVRSLHEALPLLSDRSDSGRETRVRRAITSAGLPAPSPQHRVYDDHGELIGVADQAFPEYRVLLEYEGDHHRTDRRQWNIDLVRFNRYQQSGWIALRIEARQLAALTPMLDSVESALRSRGWRRDA